jgi:hypothetical protein
MNKPKIVRESVDVSLVRIMCTRCNKGFFEAINSTNDENTHVCSFCREKANFDMRYPRLEARRIGPKYYTDHPIWSVCLMGVSNETI